MWVSEQERYAWQPSSEKLPLSWYCYVTNDADSTIEDKDKDMHVSVLTTWDIFINKFILHKTMTRIFLFTLMHIRFQKNIFRSSEVHTSGIYTQFSLVLCLVCEIDRFFRVFFSH